MLLLLHYQVGAELHVAMADPGFALRPAHRTMRDGELVIFDVGTELDYYVTDVGRTFPVSGKFTEEQKRTLDMVTAVSDAIIAAVRPGVSHRELARVGGEKMPPAARKYMQPTAFNGHHIGLDTSDPANLDAVPCSRHGFYRRAYLLQP